MQFVLAGSRSSAQVPISPPNLRSSASRLLRFARNVARWGIPSRSLLFGPLSLGDDLLCTAVLREARKRGSPFTMMSARPEVFAGNSDPLRVLPIDDDYVAGLRRLGARVIQPYYVGAHPNDPERDVLPGRHIITEMCALAGLQGTIALRPYLSLSHAERTAGKLFPSQIAVHSSGLSARIPYPTKEWGAERWAETARLLRPHSKLIQIGTASDPALPVDVDLRGRTTLRDAAGIIASSALFIGLEGFLTHLARAVDCPAVVVMGGRAPESVFGYSANRNLTAFPECAPCARRTGCPHDLHCMAAITPAALVEAALALLALPRGPLPVETAYLP